jgi:hypothetical protein
MNDAVLQALREIARDVLSPREEPTVAERILEQMGGAGVLRAMTGAKVLIASPRGLTFRFRGSRRFNCCGITLQPDDTYTMVLHKLGRCCEIRRELQVDDIYADQLRLMFTAHTGLALTL